MHEDFDSEIEELADDFGEGERTLLFVVRSFLAGQLTYEDAHSALGYIILALVETFTRWVEAVVPRIYADGITQGSQTHEDGPGAPTSDLHDTTLDYLSEDLHDELSAAAERLHDDGRGALREIERRRIASMFATGSGTQPESREMSREMDERGVKFVDRNGRRWNSRDYARLVLRTHAVKIANEANLNTATELASPGVRVSDGGPGDTDEPCRRADGQTWSVEYARRNILEHPNCRRAFAPLPKSFEGELDRGTRTNSVQQPE